MTLHIMVSVMDKFYSDKTVITSEEFSTVHEADKYITALKSTNNLLLYSVTFKRYGEVLYRTHSYKNYYDISDFLRKVLDSLPDGVHDDDIIVSLMKELSEADNEFGNDFVFTFFSKFSYIPVRGSVSIIGQTTPGMGDKYKELGKFIKKNRHMIDEVSNKIGFNLLDIPEHLISDEGLGVYALAHDVAGVIGNYIYTVTKNK